VNNFNDKLEELKKNMNAGDSNKYIPVMNILRVFEKCGGV